MVKYFAYGTNCDPEVLRNKGVSYTTRQKAALHGYRLIFNKQSFRETLPNTIGFANVVAFKEGRVEGVLYEIREQDLAKLDESQRYPEHYDRIRTLVDADTGDLECWVYIAQKKMTAEGLVPSRNYLNHILAGREFLSQQYFDALDQSQVYTDECASCGRSGEVLFVKENNRLYTLCQCCREARLKWGDALNRPLTVDETAGVMMQLVMPEKGFSSIEALIEEAVARKIISTDRPDAL